MRGRKKIFMIDPFQIIRLFLGRAEGRVHDNKLSFVF